MQTAYKIESPQQSTTTGKELAMQRRLSDIVAEYDAKLEALPQALAEFEAAGTALKSAACIGGTWGQTSIDTGRVYIETLKASLLKSAWQHVYDGLNIERLASANDKKRFEQGMQKPAPFTLDNIRGTLGDYLINPRANILRGLAEVFSDLDPAFKSHDKVRIGVKGLPKRVIVGWCGGYDSYGQNKVRDLLNALASYQQKPLVEYQELQSLWKEENALLAAWESTNHRGEPVAFPARGVRLRRFGNGNGHLFFEPDALRDINLALAEYYGEVLPDCSEERPEQQRPGTAVSKDLQYYPTPAAVVERVLSGLSIGRGEKVLEPSCGCGRFMDALRAKGAEVLGIEVDPGRVAIARAKGHNVMRANFLEALPTGDFDRVVMNPPFLGKWYMKHLRHAFKFLREGGQLVSILPCTAKYDHGLLDNEFPKGRWYDLPVGSFSESGTNINTGVFSVFK